MKKDKAAVGWIYSVYVTHIIIAYLYCPVVAPKTLFTLRFTNSWQLQGRIFEIFSAISQLNQLNRPG